MSTYSDASLILPVAPERRAGLIYSLKPTDGTGDFTVARAGKRHEINSDLKLEIIDNNVPAFNFDTIGGCPVLNTERQVTNLITYPITFSNAYWTLGRATLTSGQSAPSVDFPTSAFKLVEDTSTGSHCIYGANTNVTDLEKYTISFYVKNDGRFRYKILGGVMLDIDATFNLNDLTTTGGGIIESLANDWFRISATGTATATGATNPVLYLLNNAGTQSYTGDGTSGAYIFMAQFEQSSSATSPTFTDITLAAEGSTTTRLADDITGGGDVNTFNSLEGVLEVSMSALSDDLTDRGISISDGTVNNIIEIFYTNVSNAIQFKFTVGGVDQVNELLYVTDITDTAVIKFKYKVNDFGIKIDGVEVATDTSGGVPSANTFTVMNLKRITSSAKLFANVNYIKYYNDITSY